MLHNPEIDEIVVVEDVLATRSKASAKPSRGLGSAFNDHQQHCPSGAESITRTLIGTAKRSGWMLLLCGLSVLVLRSVALAGDPIPDAFSLMAEKRYSEAYEALEPALESRPDAADVRLALGILRARQGSFLEAIDIFEHLQTDYPDLFEVHNNLAVLYAKLGRLDDAHARLLTALALRPDAAIAHTNLGDVHMRLAARAYARANELGGGDSASVDLNADNAAATGELRTEGAEDSADPGAAADAVSADLDTDNAADAREPRADVATDSEAEAAADPNVEPPTKPLVSAASSEAKEEEAEPVGAQEAPASADTAAAGEACVQAGAFKERSAASEATEWMRSHGAEPIEIRHEERRVIRNYQVYLPAYSSREEAVEKADELRGRGVRDIWIIGGGERANGISLGVFRSEGNARRRIAELEKLGYPVASVANANLVSTYAVEASVSGDRSDFDDAWSARFPEQPVRSVACAAPS